MLEAIIVGGGLAGTRERPSPWHRAGIGATVHESAPSGGRRRRGLADAGQATAWTRSRTLGLADAVAAAGFADPAHDAADGVGAGAGRVRRPGQTRAGRAAGADDPPARPVPGACATRRPGAACPISYGRRLVDGRPPPGGRRARRASPTAARPPADLLDRRRRAPLHGSATLIDPAARAGPVHRPAQRRRLRPRASTWADRPGVLDFCFGRRCFLGLRRPAPPGDVWWFTNPPSAEPGRGELARISEQDWRDAAARSLRRRRPADAPPCWRRADELLRRLADLRHPDGAHGGTATAWSSSATPSTPPRPASGQGASMAFEDAVTLARSACGTVPRRRRRSRRTSGCAGARVGGGGRSGGSAPATPRHPGRSAAGCATGWSCRSSRPRACARARTRPDAWLTGHHIDWDEPGPRLTGSGTAPGTPERAPGQEWRPVARPSIVPIALTLDDRTGYTLWAPPWEEDGEEWQAFLGTTEDDAGAAVPPLPDPCGARGVLPDQHRPRPRRPPGVAGRGRPRRRRPDAGRRPPLRPRRRLRHRRREPRPLGRRGAGRDDRHRQPAGRVPRHQRPERRRGARRRRDRGPVRGGRRARRQARDRLPGPRRRRLRRPLRRGRLGRRRRRRSTTSGRTSSRSSTSTWTGPAPARRPSRTTRRRRRSRRSTRDELPDDVVLVDDDDRRAARPCGPSPGAAGSAPPPPRSPRPASSGSRSASCRSRWSSPRAPGSRCAATSRTSPASSAATARCSCSTPPPTSRASARATRTHDLMEIASWPEVADTDVPPLPGRPGPLRPHRAVRGPHRGGRRRGRAGRPPGLRPAGRGRPRPRRVRGPHARRRAARPDRAAGPRGRPRPRASRTPTCRPRTPPSCGRRGTRSSPRSAERWSSATDRTFGTESPARRSGRPREIPGPAASSFRCSQLE